MCVPDSPYRSWEFAAAISEDSFRGRILECSPFASKASTLRSIVGNAHTYSGLTTDIEPHMRASMVLGLRNPRQEQLSPEEVGVEQRVDCRPHSSYYLSIL
jgi:hypothetical protein